jgi:hypothetical protein
VFTTGFKHRKNSISALKKKRKERARLGHSNYTCH